MRMPWQNRALRARFFVPSMRRDTQVAHLMPPNVDFPVLPGTVTGGS